MAFNDITAIVVLAASAFVILSSLKYVINFTIKLLLPLTVLVIGISLVPGLRERIVGFPSVQMATAVYDAVWNFMAG